MAGAINAANSPDLIVIVSSICFSLVIPDLGAPLDPRTKRRIGTYGIHADTATNDAYLLDFSAGNIVKIDAKTRETTVYLTPSPNSTTFT